MKDPEREIEESWQQNAGAWTEAVRGEEIESRRVATNRAVIDTILERAPERVLDVGCGEGWLAHSLAERGIEVFGFDSSAELLERASEGAGAFHLLSYEDFAANPGQLGTDYDLVVCNFSLLGREIGPVLRACAEALRGGGALVVQTPHPFTDPAEGPYEDGWRREDYRVLDTHFPASMPWYQRTVGTWVRELVGNGFRLDAVREPVHPETGRPLSLILIGLRS